MNVGSRYARPGRILALAAVSFAVPVFAWVATLQQSTPPAIGQTLTEPGLSTQLAMAEDATESAQSDAPKVAICFAPGTDRETVDAFCETHPELCAQSDLGGPRYDLANRWSGNQGSPRALTWSLVPDGTSVSTGGGYETSVLFSNMDAKFGGRGWISKIQDCFDRWEELTGLSYTRITVGGNDWDDGTTVSGTNSGTATRGDIRISSFYIDGGSGVLAYNWYPSNGDMVLDSSENWHHSSGDYIFLRNILMHEHGHGIGMAHKCPVHENTLLEPYYTDSFDGPQHDDIRAAQRHYGDPYEDDDSSATATHLGTVSFGGPVSLGPVPSPGVDYGSVLGIDDDGEEDWFSFTVTQESQATVIVTPIGHYYEDTIQDDSCGGSIDCCYGEFTQSVSSGNLNVNLVGQDGSSVLTGGYGNTSPAGEAEVLQSVLLVGGAGTFYIKVYQEGYQAETQLYYLSVSVAGADQDLTPPQPDPVIILPDPPYTYGSGPGEITLTAQTCTDDTPPIEYEFTTLSSGSGAHNRTWGTNPVYTDTGMPVNTLQSYKARAKDSEVPPNYTDLVTAPVIYIYTGCRIPGQPTLALGTPPESAMTLTVDPLDNPSYTRFAILCLNSDDPAWNGKYANTDGTPSDTPVWDRLSNWGTISLTGLQNCTEYTFGVKARNYDEIETTYGPSDTLSTEGCEVPCYSDMGDVNDDTYVDGVDIQCFIGCLVSTGDGCFCACGNYQEPAGVGMEDVTDFVNAILGL